MSETTKEMTVLGILGVGVLFGIYLLFGWIFGSGSGTATVTGVATLEGRPIEGADVVFAGEAEGNQAPIIAKTDAEGRFTLIGNAGPTIRTDKYKVAVVLMTLKDGTVPKGEAARGLPDDAYVNQLPTPYSDVATTPITIDVRRGSQSVAVALKRNP